MPRAAYLIGLLVVLAAGVGCGSDDDDATGDDDDATGDDDDATGDDDVSDDDDDTSGGVDFDGDGWTDDGGDCDDTEATVHPGAEEICDGITDNDCDGVADPAEVDGDGDAYSGCDGDCNDNNAAAYPGAELVCFDGILDNDCDDVIDANELDSDSDGFSACTGDCDDGDALIFPGASELCDDLDNDCDGLVDEGYDVDGDGWTLCEGDCDDYDDTVHPGAAEICDGQDNDCDGSPDPTEADADWDGWRMCDGDCDDADELIHPGATEECDGVDNDCDGIVDDGMNDDLDADGWSVCDGDCDDANDDTYPGAQDVCDGQDNDCDGWVDESTCGTNLLLADARFYAETPDDRAGWAVSPAGDVNSDGYDDILVGAYGNNGGGSDTGAAYLIHGPVTGSMNLWSADAKLVGETSGDYAGYAISSAGDVNADGYDDLLVGAYLHDTGGTDAGAAYIVLGPVTGTRDLSLADAKLVGVSSGDYAGHAVSSAGDVDGDGHDDLLVGADYADGGSTDSGEAYLVLGPMSGIMGLSAADARFVGESDENHAGRAVSSAGDVNGDGYDDVLVGAYQNDEGGYHAGAVYVVLGPVSGTMDLSMADAKLLGEQDEDKAGWAASSAGDINGDGFDDILVGTRYHDAGGTDAGAVYLVHGPMSGTADLGTADAKIVGAASEDQTGYSVSSAGDVNDDGYDDILVGAIYQAGHHTEGGAAYLLHGPVSGTVPLSPLNDIHAKFVGEADEDRAGCSVSSAGDVNGDGYADILVGAKGNDRAGYYAGAAYLLLGRP